MKAKNGQYLEGSEKCGCTRLPREKVTGDKRWHGNPAKDAETWEKRQQNKAKKDGWAVLFERHAGFEVLRVAQKDIEDFGAV